MNRYEIWDQGYRCRICICLSYVMLKGRRQVWAEGYGDIVACGMVRWVQHVVRDYAACGMRYAEKL